MKTYLLDSLNRIKRKGENLYAKTILCNKSWLIFNDSGDKELYIFQENGEVLISLNGIVSKGSWQYIPANKNIVKWYMGQSPAPRLNFKKSPLFVQIIFHNNTIQL